MQGWNSLTVNLFGRELEGITELQYSDNVEVSSSMGRGQYAQGTEISNYEAECGMTVKQEEWQAMSSQLPPNTRIHEAVTDVTVTYEANGQIYTDVLRNFRVTGTARTIAQGDGSIDVELSCFCTHIDYNV